MTSLPPPLSISTLPGEGKSSDLISDSFDAGKEVKEAVVKLYARVAKIITTGSKRVRRASKKNEKSQKYIKFIFLKFRLVAI